MAWQNSGWHYRFLIIPKYKLFEKEKSRGGRWLKKPCYLWDSDKSMNEV
jgi:hypothetical protein